MKKVREPYEIEVEISRLEWTLKELKEELHVANAIANPDYKEYKDKWVFHDAYESGWSCVYVLGVVPGDDVYFYGYGVEYNEQTKKLTIISRDYPEDFYIGYPDNLTIIEESEVADKIFEMLSVEFEECF